MALVNACGYHHDKVVTFRELTGESVRLLLHANAQRFTAQDLTS